MSLILQNAILVQFDPALVRHGQLRVADGRISAIDDHLARQAGDEVVDCGGAVVLPGLVNGHTHAYASLAPGMPPPIRTPRDFHEILRFVWWRLDRAHNEASIRVSGQISALAAIRCGTTTLIDHHASPGWIEGSLGILEEGISAIGCRAVLCYETTDRNGRSGAWQGIDENKRYVDACRNRRTHRFAGMIGAHASFTLSDETLATCVDACRICAAGLHIHVAEDPLDDRLTREMCGWGLTERLQRHGVFELDHSLLAHATHLDQEGLDRVHQCAGLWVAHNPGSNMNNGVGYAPVAGLSGRLVLGTDGIGADMWREARLALFKSNDARLPVAPEHILKALAQSARLASHYLGVPLGVLEVGAAADLVITDYRPATPLDAANLAGHVLFAMGPEYVRHVIVDGEWCLRDRKVVSCDEPALRAEAAETARQLYARMQNISCE